MICILQGGSKGNYTSTVVQPGLHSSSRLCSSKSPDSVTVLIGLTASTYKLDWLSNTLIFCEATNACDIGKLTHFHAIRVALSGQLDWQLTISRRRFNHCICAAKGWAHSVLVSPEGKVQACGWNRYGQAMPAMEDRETEGIVQAWLIVEPFPTDLKIKQVAAGEHHRHAHSPDWRLLLSSAWRRLLFTMLVLLKMPYRSLQSRAFRSTSDLQVSSKGLQSIFAG